MPAYVNTFIYVSNVNPKVSLWSFISLKSTSFPWHNVAIAQASTNGGAASGSTEEEEYVPPKPEVENKITEEDSVYTKR